MAREERGDRVCLLLLSSCLCVNDLCCCFLSLPLLLFFVVLVFCVVALLLPWFWFDCGQLVDICSSQLDEWSAAGAGPIDMAAEGKNLSFEFSTQLLVSLSESVEIE